MARLCKLAVPLVLPLMVLLIPAGCRDAAETSKHSDGVQQVSATSNLSTVDSVEEAKIMTFCGDCHAMPDPTSFPRRAWHDEVKRGFDFYYVSGRTDLEVPIQEAARRYFMQRAPETVEIAKPAGVDHRWRAKFQQLEVFIPDVNNPAISFIESVDFAQPLGRGVLFSDMRGGGIYFSKDSGDSFDSPIRLGSVRNPAAVRVCDWDQDGRMDLMVADLGSFLPADHDRGQVVWLRQTNDPALAFEAKPLATGLGRVASVEIADFNQDGLQEILVAEFGWQSTGSISLLSRNDSTLPADTTTITRLDDRSGTIHIPVADLNGDGHLDFVALISQHHECIDAFLNDGKGNFQRKRIFSAPEPAFGSSGIQMVDWNENGKLDILYSNGDAFDSFYLKPSHGIRWLENLGDGTFNVHEIGKMPGVHRALVFDLGEEPFSGVKTIVAGAFLPNKLLRTQGIDEAEGLVLWRGQVDGAFQKHVLTQAETSYAALAIHQLNERLPVIVVGHFRETDTGSALTIWKPQ